MKEKVAVSKNPNGNYEANRLSLITDGTRHFTKVLLSNGEELRGVTRVEIDLTNSEPAVATLTVELKSITTKGKLRTWLKRNL